MTRYHSEISLTKHKKARKKQNKQQTNKQRNTHIISFLAAFNPHTLPNKMTPTLVTMNFMSSLKTSIYYVSMFSWMIFSNSKFQMIITLKKKKNYNPTFNYCWAHTKSTERIFNGQWTQNERTVSKRLFVKVERFTDCTFRFKTLRIASFTNWYILYQPYIQFIKALHGSTKLSNKIGY